MRRLRVVDGRSTTPTRLAQVAEVQIPTPRTATSVARAPHMIRTPALVANAAVPVGAGSTVTA
ncbi:hypothetical protein [Modestobacter marinus]|uniref:hypothetical protein n=1 Tax=Modestobacter marinus TaxID=477641 RepID=UPI001C93E24E|nr:hypothetical protein [Modestobacter marinus]